MPLENNLICMITRCKIKQSSCLILTKYIARILKTMGDSSVKNSTLAKTNQKNQLSTCHLFLHNTIINVAISKVFDNFSFPLIS